MNLKQLKQIKDSANISSVFYIYCTNAQGYPYSNNAEPTKKRSFGFNFKKGAIYNYNEFISLCKELQNKCNTTDYLTLELTQKENTLEPTINIVVKTDRTSDWNNRGNMAYECSFVVKVNSDWIEQNAKNIFNDIKKDLNA